MGSEFMRIGPDLSKALSGKTDSPAMSEAEVDAAMNFDGDEKDVVRSIQFGANGEVVKATASRRVNVATTEKIGPRHNMFELEFNHLNANAQRLQEAYNALSPEEQSSERGRAMRRQYKELEDKARAVIKNEAEETAHARSVHAAREVARQAELQKGWEAIARMEEERQEVLDRIEKEKRENALRKLHGLGPV